MSLPEREQHKLGYSFNRELAFHRASRGQCSACASTGGSSRDGRGTIISIFFWGYASITACPFQGAKNAFEAAKFTPFDDVVGKRGIVVDNREQTEGVREKTDKAPQKGVEDFS